MKLLDFEGLFYPPYSESVSLLRGIRGLVVGTQDNDKQQRYLRDAAGIVDAAARCLTLADFTAESPELGNWLSTLDANSSEYKNQPSLTYNDYNRPPDKIRSGFHHLVLMWEGTQNQIKDSWIRNIPTLYFDSRWVTENSGVLSPLSVDYLLYYVMSVLNLKKNGQSFDVAPVVNWQGTVVISKSEDGRPVFADRESIGIGIFNYSNGTTYREISNSVRVVYPGRPIHPLL